MAVIMFGSEAEDTSFRSRATRNSVRCSVVWTIVVTVILVSITSCQSADINCASVKYKAYEGFGGSAVPKDPQSGVQLRVCPKEQTCCTPEMEHILSTQSRQEFDKAVKDTLGKLATLLKTRSQKFDDFFKTMLSASKRDFHDMFTRTYGVIYEQNSYVFTDMFEQLEKYYLRGQVNLGEAMENFFNTLYLKMFTVLNGQYHFDDKYLGCVGDHMKDLKPFGDVPHKLSTQLKRSFIATRTFSQALQVSSDVVNQMQKINPSADCVRALTKMTGCPHCQGLPEVKACSNYCINVMKGCLAYQAELNGDWNNFVDQMEKVAERLVGPFNIELVVEPINIKISEAIMNFQENGPEISQRVFQGCGKPALGRKRREVNRGTVAVLTAPDTASMHRRRRESPQRDTTELEFESLSFGRGTGGSSDGGKGGSDGAKGVPTLEKLVRDIRVKVRDSKQFWSNLPYTICNDDHVAASPKVETTCWNGAMKAKYEPQITGDGISNQKANPEVVVDVNRPSSLLNEQAFSLKTITSNLQNAYQGKDVEWFDTEEETSLFGSSGSGSGGGAGEDDLESSGDDDVPTVHRPMKPHAPDSNAEDNELHPLGGAIRGSANATSDASAPLRHAAMNRTVRLYVLSIVVTWCGRLFSAWV